MSCYKRELRLQKFEVKRVLIMEQLKPHVSLYLIQEVDFLCYKTLLST